MRRVTAARGAMIALMLTLFAPIASADGQETFYLGSDGFPNASLDASPRGGEMPNFDLSRDIEPGLLLERSSLGLAETADVRYQHWQVRMGGRRIAGYPSVVIWAAPAGFDAGMKVAFSVYLLDCNLLGSSCTEIDSEEATIQKGRGGAWVETTLDFDQIDHRFGDERYLAVRVVVSEESESDVMIAYGYPKYRSRLTVGSEPPATAAETTIVASQAASSDSEIRADKMPRVRLALSVQDLDVGGIGSTWQWLASLALSTIALVVLGGFLISRLAKAGRHERRFVSRRSKPAQTRRISVSAR